MECFNLNKGFRVHRNLKKNKKTWTIKAYHKTKKSWIIFLYLDNFIGIGCTPVESQAVQEKIKRKYLEENRKEKTPHAYIMCKNLIIGSLDFVDENNYSKFVINYDPFIESYFYINGNVDNRYYKSEMCLFEENGLLTGLNKKQTK